jgi:hypothetical protein
MMEVYKNRWFHRWARKEGLEDSSLCAAVREMVAGLYDADLGSGLVKKRIARPGKGKSGGFRTLIATNKDDRWIFIYGFPKNERSNIDKDEEQTLKEFAEELLSLTPKEIEQVKNEGKLFEVNCNEETEIGDS